MPAAVGLVMPVPPPAAVRNPVIEFGAKVKVLPVLVMVLEMV